MPDTRISFITPSSTIPEGRIAIVGDGFPVGRELPSVRIGGEPARVVFASTRELGVVVPSSQSGLLTVEVAGIVADTRVEIATPVATGLHQVDNPAVDRDGNLFLTYSGTRGQQVPVSNLSSVARRRTRELLVERHQPHQHGHRPRWPPVRLESLRRRRLSVG
ncbi:MAG: IPT/TIG domain-containing protein [Vicinamibacterales bacterium]